MVGRVRGRKTIPRTTRRSDDRIHLLLATGAQSFDARLDETRIDYICRPSCQYCHQNKRGSAPTVPVQYKRKKQDIKRNPVVAFTEERKDVVPQCTRPTVINPIKYLFVPTNDRLQAACFLRIQKLNASTTPPRRRPAGNCRKCAGS